MSLVLSVDEKNTINSEYIRTYHRFFGENIPTIYKIKITPIEVKDVDVWKISAIRWKEDEIENLAYLVVGYKSDKDYYNILFRLSSAQKENKEIEMDIVYTDESTKKYAFILNLV